MEWWYWGLLLVYLLAIPGVRLAAWRQSTFHGPPCYFLYGVLWAVAPLWVGFWIAGWLVTRGAIPSSERI